jgi:CheY-like chemotaxis protein
MVEFTTFEEDLRNFLQHFHSPDFQVPMSLCEMFRCTPEQSVAVVHAQVTRAIEQLKPPENIPADSDSWRANNVLRLRFLNGLSQDETAERLSLSTRHCQRIQAEAVRTLALQLWTIDSGLSHDENENWLAQVKFEISSLEANAPEITTEVQKVLFGLLELKEQLTTAYGIELEIGYIQPGLTARANPTVLRQVIILILGRLARYISSGKIEIFAGLHDGKARITISGHNSNGIELDKQKLIEEIFMIPGGYLDIKQNGDQVFVQISLPSTKQHVVLVVEDNLDMVLFYRRCTVGTNFQIVHASSADQVKEVILTTAPEIIVLDVMMPDIDGWQLLTHLHENPETREIPVIVCSIIQEPGLAYTLGAVNCLRKPVKHQVFVDALNQALKASL